MLTKITEIFLKCYVTWIYVKINHLADRDGATHGKKPICLDFLEEYPFRGQFWIDISVVFRNRRVSKTEVMFSIFIYLEFLFSQLQETTYFYYWFFFISHCFWNIIRKIKTKCFNKLCHQADNWQILWNCINSWY